MTSPFRDEEVSPATSLTQAAADGDLQAVQALLAGGADVNSRNESGQSALMLAALMGHAELATRLMDAGADPNLRDQFGLTAQEWAKRRGFSEIAQALDTSAAPVHEPEPQPISVAEETVEKAPVQVAAAPETSEQQVESEQAAAAVEFPEPELSGIQVIEVEPATDVDSAQTYSEPIDAEPPTSAEKPLTEADEPRVLAAELRAAADSTQRDVRDSHGFAEQPPEVGAVSPAELYALGDIPKTDTTHRPVKPAEPQSVIEPVQTAPVATQSAPPITESVPSSPAVDHRDITSDAPSSSTREIPLSEETHPGVPRPIHHEIPREPRVPAEFSRVEVKPPVAPQTRSTKVSPAYSGSKLGLSSAIDDSTDVSGLRRCPKCNTVYENTWQLFCTKDRTPLIGGNDPNVNAATNTSHTGPIVIWLLIAFVLGASAFAGYRLTRYLYRPEPAAPVAAKPAEVPPEAKKASFTVGGDLTGTELTIPEPTYPAALQNSGVGGPITVKVRVNKNGRVTSTATTTGDSQLRAAATKAARLATFAPDKLAAAHPKSRVFTGTITYEFVQPKGTATETSAPTDNSAASPPEATSNADPNAPVVSSELASAARDIPSAEYPANARRDGVEGTVTVTVRVNRNGKVVSWRTTPGNSALRAAAIRAARKATFSSDKLPGDGDVLGSITYTFKP